MKMCNISICIPTYKRTHLLKLLIQDLFQQNTQPDHIIVVDGDPNSGSVMEMLNTLDSSIRITYVPSNHGNLAYQRYLGWKAVDMLNVEILIYLDDDERLLQEQVIEYLINPFSCNEVVGL